MFAIDNDSVIEIGALVKRREWRMADGG